MDTFAEGIGQRAEIEGDADREPSPLRVAQPRGDGAEVHIPEEPDQKGCADRKPSTSAATDVASVTLGTITRVKIRFGFQDEQDVPTALGVAQRQAGKGSSAEHRSSPIHVPTPLGTTTLGGEA